MIELINMKPGKGVIFYHFILNDILSGYECKYEDRLGEDIKNVFDI